MKLKAVFVAALLGLASAVPSFADWVYVGSWNLGDINGNYGNPNNPYIWYNNPAVFSGVEAAALLFGGSAADYAISTISSNVSDINHLAFLDGWGDTQYLYNPQSETFKLDSGAPGYNDPYGGPSYSAYVVDHAVGGTYINYAFRREASSSVPDTGWTLGFMGLAFMSLAAVRRHVRA